MKLARVLDQQGRSHLDTASKLVRVYPTDTFSQLLRRHVPETLRGPKAMVRILLQGTTGVAFGAATEVENGEDSVWEALKLARLSQGYDPEVIVYVVRKAGASPKGYAC